MAYKVIRMFVDLQDRNHMYREGDVYPREGTSPTAERIKSLLTGNNKAGAVFIAPAEIEADASDAEEKPHKRGPGRPRKTEE